MITKKFCSNRLFFVLPLSIPWCVHRKIYVNLINCLSCVTNIYSNRAVFFWVSKLYRFLLHYTIGLKTLALFLIQSEVKPNSSTRVFPRFASVTYSFPDLIGSLNFCPLRLARLNSLVYVLIT